MTTEFIINGNDPRMMCCGMRRDQCRCGNHAPLVENDEDDKVESNAHYTLSPVRNRHYPVSAGSSNVGDAPKPVPIQVMNFDDNPLTEKSRQQRRSPRPSGEPTASRPDYVLNGSSGGGIGVPVMDFADAELTNALRRRA